MSLINANNINNIVSNNDNIRRHIHKKLVEVAEGGGGGGGSQEWATNQNILSLFNDTYDDSVENDSIILGTPNIEFH